MSIDPAVRSIRVAKTLADRFAELLRGPSTFDSAFAAGSLDGLELRIGEAQQIYPEIWGHLDDARKVLADRGVDVSGFDRVRATEPRGSIGVTRVDVENYATTLTSKALGLVDEQVKSASFNLEGLRRANAATQELMSAMPEVDWAGLARAEAAEVHAAGSLGPINPKSALRWLLIAGGAVLVTYAFWFLVIRVPPPDHEAAAAREREAHARHIAELQHQLEESPCDRAVLRQLGRDGGPVPSPREGDARCKTYLDELEGKLDRVPCDPTLFKQVTMASRWFGESMAVETGQHYRELCAAAKTAPNGGTP